MSAMASSEKDLAVFLQQHKIPALVVNELSASLTFGAFAMLAASPDELAKTVQDSLSSEAVAMLNPFVLANIKAAWSAALSTFASSSSGQPSSATTLDAAKSSDVASWSDTFPPKLSASFTKQIITRFESAYPGDILDDSSTPSSRLLALCNKYLADKSFKYIPWHLRLSEKTQEELSLHRPRKVPRLEELLWDDVPSRDIPSNGISQMFLFHLLELISIAYAMLEATHLSSFRKYNKLFISLAFRKHQVDVGLRNPTVIELQQADRAAWKVINDLCVRGWTLDDALHEVVEVRCVLHSELQPRPAPPKLIRTAKGRGKGKKAKLALPSSTQQKWITSFTDAGGKKLELCKGWNLRVVAIARIVSSFTNAALMSMVSPACATTRLTSTPEEATRSLGRLSSGRWYRSPLQVCILHQTYCCHRKPSSQCLPRLF